MMLVETDALAREPKEIRRVALRDEVGPQPVPDHQDYDTSAPAMRRNGVLRTRRRGDEYEQERENFRQPSDGKHSIGHQTGPQPTVSIILRDRLYRRRSRMRLEKFPDDVGRVQTVARLADPFFRQPILTAGPEVPQSLDAGVLELSA